MKKALALLLLCASGLSLAAQINIGTFPVGKWLDPNYDAVWEIASDNIRILSKDLKTVHYDFSKATIEGFKVDAGAAGVAISWSCKETGKFYKLTKTLTDMNIVLEIDRPDQPHYSVSMTMLP